MNKHAAWERVARAGRGPWAGRHLGFLHQPDHGRASLALDLLEAFRYPVADLLVRTLVKQDFESRLGAAAVLPADQDWYVV